MAMKPYNSETWGQSNTWSKYGGYATVNRVVARKSLGNITTTHGDYKTPNRHTYYLSRARGYEGKRTRYANREQMDWTQGVQPYVYNYGPHVPADFESSALSMALSKAYDELRGNIDSSVDLVQWRKTVDMLRLYRRLVKGIAEAGVAMARSVKQVKRLERERSLVKRYSRRGRRITRQLNHGLNMMARARLEYAFGWRPTMGTIYDLAILATHPPGPGLITVSGSGSLLQTKKALDYSIDPNGPVTHYITISDRARVKMFYNPSVNIMTDLAKISSLNPVSIMYELMPFSFVLDWAIDVGGWIRTLETAFLHRNNFIVGWSTQVQRTNIRSEMHLKAAEPGYLPYGTYTDWALNGQAVVTRFDRKILNSAPFPTRPAKRQKFGVETQLTALALAKSVLLDADKMIAGRR